MLSQFVWEKTRNILYLTSFREEKNIMLPYFYSIKHSNTNIQKSYFYICILIDNSFYSNIYLIISTIVF